jgi:hypothetical protein
MGIFILLLLVGICFFIPSNYLATLFEFFGTSVFGVPLWAVSILFVFLVQGFKPSKKKAEDSMKEKSTAQEKKSMAQKAIDVLDPRKKSTTKEKLEVTALVALARKFFLKPELTFDTPDVFVESTVPSGLNSWKLTIKRHDYHGSTQLSMPKGRNSGNFGLNGNANYKVKWVEFSLADLSEKHQKIFKAYLLALLLKEK